MSDLYATSAPLAPLPLEDYKHSIAYKHLARGEVVYVFSRPWWQTWFNTMGVGFVFVLAGLGVSGGAALSLIGGLIMWIGYANWANSIFLVTNKRIMLLHGLFGTENVISLPFENIESYEQMFIWGSNGQYTFTGKGRQKIKTKTMPDFPKIRTIFEEVYEKYQKGEPLPTEIPKVEPIVPFPMYDL